MGRALTVALLALLLASGCAMQGAAYDHETADRSAVVAEQAPGFFAGNGAAGGRVENILDGFSTALGPTDLRLVIRRCAMTLEVESLNAAADAVEALAVELDGYVESRNTGERRGSLTIRVPSSELETTMDRLAALGTEVSRSVDARDVTNEVSDLSARLASARAIRDRLKALLAKTTTVRQALAIEAQLARVMGEIERMERRLASLKEQVALSTITVSLRRRPIDGPLTAVGKGTWWVVEKLFVLQR